MTADECEFCHEDYCIAHLIHNGFKCPGMKKDKDSILTECTLSNDDLMSEDEYIESINKDVKSCHLNRRIK